MKRPIDVCVIGGGIVGLATACQLLESKAKLSVCVIEKEAEPGRHQSGHNSGVIHSGIYYRPGSLKAQNCVRGYKLLLAFLEREEIPFEICGKLIVATEPAELGQLAVLEKRGAENGLTGIEHLRGAEQIREREPHCAGLEALWVPQTGIVDFRLVCQALLRRFQHLGGQVVFGREIHEISERNGHVELASHGDGDTVVTRYVVNCAGLHSDRLARFADPELGLRIVPFRGEYYRLLPEARHLVRNLIYPVPNPEFPFLGVHFTRTAWGDIDAGPNAVLALKREGYGRTDVAFRDLWETVTWPGFSRLVAQHWQQGCKELFHSWYKPSFVKALQRLIPELRGEHLEPAAAGVRAQACGRDGKLLDDFHLLRVSRQLHVCNAPSPAATSSLSIGQTLAEHVLPALS